MSDQRPGYVIVSGHSTEQLKKHVLEALKDGYVPIGGIAVLEYDHGYGHSPEYVQSMVLKEVLR